MSSEQQGHCPVSAGFQFELAPVCGRVRRVAMGVGLLVGLVGGALALSGCVLPVDRKDLPALVKALAESGVSACLWVGGRGGVAAGPVVPPVPAGGYGSGELVFGRVNSADLVLVVKDAGCEIRRGVGAPPSPVLRSVDSSGGGAGG